MPGDRVFTDEELRIQSLRSVDALAEALEAGNREAALRFSARLRAEVASLPPHTVPHTRQFLAYEPDLTSHASRSTRNVGHASNNRSSDSQ